MQDFLKLQVWHRARGPAQAIRTDVRRFPRYGTAELRAQLTSAADSIATNIAEGAGAASQREFARFLDIAIKTTSETQHHLTVARDRKLRPAAVADEMIDEASQIRRMIHGLRKQVLRSVDG